MNLSTKNQKYQIDHNEFSSENKQCNPVVWSPACKNSQRGKANIIHDKFNYRFLQVHDGKDKVVKAENHSY
ncbi:MAG: hypothetical protein M3Z87_18760 [Lactobacillus sp.]|nr:hypothetical protein [Lactobacillus sp.]